MDNVRKHSEQFAVKRGGKTAVTIGGAVESMQFCMNAAGGMEGNCDISACLCFDENNPLERRKLMSGYRGRCCKSKSLNSKRRKDLCKHGWLASSQGA